MEEKEYPIDNRREKFLKKSKSIKINGKEITIVDSISKSYHSRYEPGFNQMLRLYVLKGTGGQVKETLHSGLNDIEIDGQIISAKRLGYTQDGSKVTTEFLFLYHN